MAHIIPLLLALPENGTRFLTLKKTEGNLRKQKSDITHPKVKACLNTFQMSTNVMGFR
jgi:hypothetical protein